MDEVEAGPEAEQPSIPQPRDDPVGQALGPRKAAGAGQ
jgi:hypothetical protein